LLHTLLIKSQCSFFHGYNRDTTICTTNPFQFTHLNDSLLYNELNLGFQLYLPDISGHNYETHIDVINYDNSYINSKSDFKLCVTLEHSNLENLELMLTSPNGIEINIFNAFTGNGLFPGGFGGGGTFLGGANDLGNNGVVGVCETYCFYDHSSSLPSWNNGYATVSTSFPYGSVIGSQMVKPDTYLPEQTFANLIGEPINGEWKITFRDNLSLDDGYVCGWEIQFLTAFEGYWNTSYGISDSTVLNPIFSPTVSNQYYFVATDFLQNCSDTFQVNITVPSEIPSVEIQGLNYVEQTSVVEYYVLNNSAYNYSWSVTNGTIIQGQNTNVISVLWNEPGYGTLYVLVQNDSCIHLNSLESLEVSIGFTGIQLNENELIIYPNPANDDITIIHENRIQKIVLYSIDGKLMKTIFNTELISPLSIDLSSYYNGMYIIKLYDIENNHTQQLIIKVK